MRTWAMTIGLLGAIALTPATGTTDDKPKEIPPPKKPQSKLMGDKLKQAQLLLDGLATNDFDKVTRSAEQLLEISKQAEFLAVKSKDYDRHTNSFRESLITIAKKAKEKNIDGATLGYVDMTLTCIRCHQHTREVRDTALPPNFLKGFGELRTRTLVETTDNTGSVKSSR